MTNSPMEGVIDDVVDSADDAFLFDRERIEQIASAEAVKKGLVCFNENRVLEVERATNRLWARVEDDEDADFPYLVMGSSDEGGHLHFSCECSPEKDARCHHLVAALFAYGDMCQEDGGLVSAVDRAIKDRRKRAKAEVQVEAESGQPWFGSWRASSINATFPRTYRVIIRSLAKRRNYCSCPDFAGNQLGTCKHIEAALHKIAKHPEFASFQNRSAPFPYVYLSWERDEAPTVCLQRGPDMGEELQQFTADYFAADGSFKARMPDDFFRFVELADNRGDIHIGEDAVDWANHQAQTASRRNRSATIRESIQAGRGKLPGIRARLYPYQVEGTAFLAGTGRALLADDMGLGKTLQAIGAATWLKNNDSVQKILIICPASLKQQWAREIEKFTDLQSRIIGGPPANRAQQYRQQATFYILNYELILRDLSIITQTLCPDLIIMDEAQRIKNWRTKIATAVKLIPCRFAFVLTGTPLENRLEDLYSLMQVVDPKILGPLWRYMVDFHVTDDRDKVLGYRNLSVLRQRLQPVMLRRDRVLVNDQLPERISQRLDVAMTAKQVELHDDAMSKAGRLAQTAKRRPLTPTEQNRLMAFLQQARMACNSAGLVDKETEESPKIDEMAVLLDEICLQEGRKVVVFSQWERMTRMVEKRVLEMGLDYVRLHGGVPTARRGELMDRFRDDDGVQVFISTDAGGVGLNLQSGSAVINLDVPWNPAVLEQRNGRVHRLGQTRKVQIITMVAADSYEQQVLGLVGNKQNLFDNVVKEDASEDVVGISKKLLETLVDSLAEENGDEKQAAMPLPELVEEETVEETADSPVEQPTSPQPVDTRTEEAIRQCIEQLQDNFGMRIERILGSQGGLICVLDRIDDAAEQLAVELSNTVPVALLDRYALQGLNRLGAHSPLAGAQTYYDHDDQNAHDTSSGPSRLQLLALEKLEAARLLARRNMAKSALDLLMNAMLARAGELAELDTPVHAAEAGVWVYGEALPRGVLQESDAALLMRAISLNQSGSLPSELFDDLLDDAAPFIEGPG